MKPVDYLSFLLILLFSFVSSQDTVCPDMEYLNVTENLCKPLPAEFGLHFNATQYDITIPISETSILPDAFLFGVKLYINNNTLSKVMPFATDIIVLKTSSALFFDFGGDGAVYTITVDNVEIFNAFEFGVVAAQELDIDFYEDTIITAFLFDGVFGDNITVDFTVNITVQQSMNPCDGTECDNGGTCVPVNADQFSCECLDGYFGDTCENVNDPCEPDPCVPHGNCSMLSPTDYTCQCDIGYTGINCSVNIDDCVGIDCGNGSCMDLVNDYQCNCVAGYTGDTCLTDIDDCASDPCVNGICTDLINDYMCECYLDWTGTNCETEINNCSDPFVPVFPCNLTGYSECIDGNDTHTCICRGGYTGEDCSIDIDECAFEPCQHNGTCVDLIGTFTCECAFGYIGDSCEIPIDFCANQTDTCINGTCNSTEAIGYECVCDPGYTGENCSIEINECDINPCENDATCIDDIADYTCICTADYTDKNCSTPINNCEPNPCLHESTCIDLFGEFMCQCSPDYTGNICEVELLFCETDTCSNGGTCFEVDGGNETKCDCLGGFSGDNCEIDAEVCDIMPQKCFNNATCVEGVGDAYSCLCLPGFNGDDCMVDLEFCNDTICQNGGTCNEGVGDIITCECPNGFSGDNCEFDDDVCDVLPQKCLNGATCNEGLADNYTCSCVDGFNGFDCGNDLDFCNDTSCTNGGTCVEGYGIETSCNCLIDFGGDQCEMELVFCMVNYCLNNGSCVDVDGGSGTLCMCVDGFSGDMCELDDKVCSILPVKCLNGGTCIEALGADYTCDCVDGFGEDDCSVDLDFCDSSFCLNGGTCLEGIGDVITCECLENYEGDICETAYCPDGWCLNGGVCSVEDNETVCDCGGCEGDRCETEVDACQSDPCKNNGTCMDGICLNYTCICAPGYSGDDCSQDLDHCTPEYCQNNGTCVEGNGVIISCSCLDCFNGDTCEIDLSFCPLLPNHCMNGGTCVDGYGCDYSCNCTDTYQGEQCEIAFCPAGWCFNSGSCVVENNQTVCKCDTGCDGDRCENDNDVCTEDLCQNGGTCTDEMCFNYSCACLSDFTGDNCETPICQLESCNNGGTCSVVENQIVCDCPPGYSGDDCSQDLDHCNPEYCQNNGTCVEGDGISISCNCLDCFNGDNCEIDLSFCSQLPDYCMNGGTCVDEYGCDYSCTCTDTYQGDQCQTAFCPEGWCFNGGSCVVEDNQAVCKCDTGCDGNRCENDNDVCTDDLCQNGGTCTDEMCFNYSCACLSDFTGENCETPICQLESCNNGGTCSVVENQIVCDCPSGYSGDDCSQDLDHCNPEYCQNNGTCVEGDGISISCNCSDCFNGDTCENDLSYCPEFPDHCMNGGTCVDGYGCDYSCNCTDTYQGEQCETAFCPAGWCFNGGSCVVEDNQAVCKCDTGCDGDRCENDNDVCTDDLCQNGGTCTEGSCSNYVCDCPSSHVGDNCQTPVCQADTCKNGGTCDVQNDILVCECLSEYTGDNCENMVDSSCKIDSDCTSNTYCEIDCPSDDYPSHKAMLFEAVTLEGVSFVSVDEARHPDLSTEFSMFAVYTQQSANRGYLIYYGTTALSRNFAIFLDSENTKLYLYYTNTTGHMQSFTVETPDLAGGYEHYLSVTYKDSFVNVYLNATILDAATLLNPDFTYGISGSTPIKLFIGARYPRHFRFVGTIKQVVFFSSVLSPTYLQKLENEFDSVFDPSGSCVSYMDIGSVCPVPMEAPSTLCTSSKDKCSPSLACIPGISDDYTCQLQPAACSSDSDCTQNYFCGSELPYAGSNYFENSDMEIPGETVFIQDDTMEFNGEEVIALPVSEAAHLESDLSIFAVVYQEPGNDGYIVGKGINGDLRDFGLYFRSSRNTVWLVYGADSNGVGFKEIVFFYNVSIADGKFHTVSAIVDSTANRTQLFIDGEIVGQQSPLPSVPTFRPGHNLLYVGGRPSTRFFRFKGTIRNLFISSAPLQKDTIMRLHNDAMDGDEQISLNLPTSRYCLPYRTESQSCVVGDDTSDFRCLSPAVCVQEFSNDVARTLPITNAVFQQLGVCIEPCDCNVNEVQEECGVDRNTYTNSCLRDCVKVTKLHNGACSICDS